MSDTDLKYDAYVHINNGGYNFSVEVDNSDPTFPYQFLTTELNSFGLPHTTRLALDDNIIEALEYVLEKAREQRKAFPRLTRAFQNTRSMHYNFSGGSDSSD